MGGWGVYYALCHRVPATSRALVSEPDGWHCGWTKVCDIMHEAQRSMCTLRMVSIRMGCYTLSTFAKQAWLNPSKPSRLSWHGVARPLQILHTSGPSPIRRSFLQPRIVQARVACFSAPSALLILFTEAQPIPLSIIFFLDYYLLAFRTD